MPLQRSQKPAVSVNMAHAAARRRSNDAWGQTLTKICFKSQKKKADTSLDGRLCYRHDFWHEGQVERWEHRSECVMRIARTNNETKIQPMGLFLERLASQWMGPEKRDFTKYSLQ